MNEANGATTGQRIRISRRGDENERCKASRAPDRRKDFSQRTSPFKIPSTSNAISPRHERTGPSRRGDGHVASPSRSLETMRATGFPRLAFDNVTGPAMGLSRFTSLISAYAPCPKGANQLRQQVYFRQHFRRGNAERDVVALLKAAPSERPVAIFTELLRPPPSRHSGQACGARSSGASAPGGAL